MHLTLPLNRFEQPVYLLTSVPATEVRINSKVPVVPEQTTAASA